MGKIIDVFPLKHRGIFKLDKCGTIGVLHFKKANPLKSGDAKSQT